MNQNEVLLRPPNDTDGSFIIDSWVREARDHYPYSNMDKSLFYKEYKEIVKTLISKSLILIACNPEETDQIYGYLSFEKVADIPIIHFIYVKLTFRENGIAKLLLQSVFDKFKSEPTLITHLPRSRKENGKFLDSTKSTLIKYNLRFDPFIISRRLK